MGRVQAGKVRRVRALLGNGANANAAPNEGQVSVLHSAAYDGQKEIAEVLLAKGAKVNARDKNGDTPLHCAAGGAVSTIETQGHRDVVELLLNRGAEINAKNDIGWTPLYVATHYGRRATAELLRQHGGQT